MVWLKVCLFVLTEFRNVTNGQTDRQTLHDGIGHACTNCTAKIKEASDRHTQLKTILPRSYIACNNKKNSCGGGCYRWLAAVVVVVEAALVAAA